jgi:hypothetical protein
MTPGRVTSPDTRHARPRVRVSAVSRKNAGPRGPGYRCQTFPLGDWPWNPSGPGSALAGSGAARGGSSTVWPQTCPSLALTPDPVPPPVRSVSDSKAQRGGIGPSPDEAGPQAGGLGSAEKVGGDGSQAVDKGSGIAILSDPRQNRSVVLRGDMPVSAASAPDPQVS